MQTNLYATTRDLFRRSIVGALHHWASLPGQLHRDQVGAGYSLSVVIMLPLYIAFMGMTIEVHLLLNSHQSVQAALQTAGHATRAWIAHRQSLELEGSSLEEMVCKCVARNLLPFATSMPNQPVQSAAELEQVLHDSGLPASAATRYVSKLDSIEQSLRITIAPQVRNCDGLLVTLEYDSPLWLPIFESMWATGRIGNRPVRTVRAETWVALADDDLHRTELGIPYAPTTVDAWMP